MKTADVPPVATIDEAPPLVFQWATRQRAHWRLAVLVALSLLIHAIGFYLFQAAYTPTGSQAAPSVQVTMLPSARGDATSENRVQARVLAQALAVDDPALTVEPVFPEKDHGDYVQYVPSYKAAPPPFKPLDPPGTGNAAPPRARPPGPVPVWSANPVLHHSPDPAPPTRVTLTGDIAPLAPGPMPPIVFALLPGAKTLSPTVFLVGVRAEGGPPFLFPENSSGDVTADDFARDYLGRLKFGSPPAAENGTTVWGWAEFDWGRDVYR